MTVIRFRRGNKDNLPDSAPSGMPLWCEDTKELYIGTDDSIAPIIGDNTSSSGFFVPYSVNSGNQDSNGYADLIEKVSDTEAAFKVGGIYPNMGITFPNGNHYTVSSIANAGNLNDSGQYVFIIEERNLVDLQDGTYLAVVTPVLTGFTTIEVSPVMTSAIEQGFEVGKYYSGNNSYVAESWQCFDDNLSTRIGFGEGTYNYYCRVKCPTPIAINKIQVYSNTNHSVYGGMSGIVVYGSNDGINWTAVFNSGSTDFRSNPVFVFENNTPYLYYKFKPNINLVGGYSQGTTYIGEIKFWYPVTYDGGTISEGAIYPETPADGDYHVLINPLRPKKRILDSWIERQFVKIGQIQKLSELLGTPISYAFNGFAIVNKSGVTKSSTYNLAHNIGSEKVDVSGYYNNVQAGSFSIGSSGYSLNLTSATTKYGSTIIVAKNTLLLRTSYNHIWYLDENNVTEFITTADTQLFVRRVF